MFRSESGGMRKLRGKAIAAGALCAVAATVALWSGPLESASGALHAGAAAGVPAVSTVHAAK
jgi:hypothetical protein